MGRYILRFTGKGSAPDADLERIHAAPGVDVLDKASPKMLLVKADTSAVADLTESLSGWTCAPEQTVPLPDPRPKLRRD
jgi:hypothetical protein